MHDPIKKSKFPLFNTHYSGYQPSRSDKEKTFSKKDFKMSFQVFITTQSKDGDLKPFSIT